MTMTRPVTSDVPNVNAEKPTAVSERIVTAFPRPFDFPLFGKNLSWGLERIGAQPLCSTDEDATAIAPSTSPQGLCVRASAKRARLRG